MNASNHGLGGGRGQKKVGEKVEKRWRRRKQGEEEEAGGGRGEEKVTQSTKSQRRLPSPVPLFSLAYMRIIRTLR